MMDRTTDMRDLVNLLDEGFGDKLRALGDEILASGGDMEAGGRKEKRELSQAMQKQYKRYLGRTGSKNSEESLMKFMVGQLDLTPRNASDLFTKVGIANPTTAESLSEDITGGQLGQLFDITAEFAFANNLVGDDAKKSSSYGRATGPGSRGGQVRNRTGSDIASDLKKAVDSKAPTFDRDAMMAAVVKIGYDTDDIKDINKKADSLAFREIADDQADMDILAAIGYAYLKFNGK